MTDPIKMTDTLPPPEPIKMAIDALTCAQQFIRNGVELGYIRMPDADCPDPAHETPGAIRAALAALAAMQQQPVAWIPDAVAEALDRMCTPLHESRLEGVTAKMDAHCMGIIRDYILSTAAAQPAQPEPAKHRFNNVSCSQCGREFGPGNFGFSHCSDHSGESYSKGIEAAAAWLDKRADDYDAEHGSDDPETGTREYPGKGAGLAYYSELRENADSIRELKTAPAAASPARPSPEWYQDKIKQTLNDDFTIGAASPAERQKYDDVLVPFVAAMRQELHANSSKGDRPGWLKMDANTALLEVYWHAAKLSAAVKNNDGPAIQEHSADVANMAMMVLDVCGGLILERKQ